MQGRGAAVLGVLLVASTVQANGHDTFEDKLGRVGRQTKTLRALFTQRKRLKLFRSEVVTKGRLFYARPDRLRWETLPPDASTLVVVGSRAELRLPDERPRTIDLRRDRAMATLVEQMLVWLGARPADRLQRWYRVKRIRDAQGYLLTLWPRAPAVRKRIRSVQVRFDRGLQLRDIHLEHPGGDTSHIELREVKRNVPLPDDLW